MIRITDGHLTADIIGSSLQKALEAIAQKSGIRIFLDGPTAEKVTIKFQNLPLDEGLRRLLHGKNAAFIYSEASGGNTTSPARLDAVYIFTGGSPGVSPDERGLPKVNMVGERAVSDAPETQDTVLGAQEATSLGESQDKGSIEALTKVLFEGPDPPLREAAATALGQTWSESAVESLGLALLGDQEATVRASAARALGETWSEAALDVLTRSLLGDPNRYVRESVALALGEIGDADAVQALIQALQDQDMSVREGAAKALGAIGSPQAAEALIQTSLNDKDPWVRESASQSAWKIFQNMP